MVRLFLITLILQFITSSLLAREVIKIATAPYPPYHEKSDGLLNRFYTALFSSVDMDVEFSMSPIRRGEVSFLKQEVDLFASHVVIEKNSTHDIDRIHLFNFAVALFYIKKENRNFKELNDVKGLGVGAIQNTPYTELYKKHQLKTVFSKDPQTLLEMAMRERFELFESTTLTGITNIKRTSKLENFDYFIFDILESGPALLKTHPKYTHIKSKLTLGLKNIINDGTYLKIYEQYWGKDNVPVDILPPELKKYGAKKHDPLKIPITVAPKIQIKI